MDFRTRRLIREAVIRQLRQAASQEEVLRLLDMRDYHGFAKSRLPNELQAVVLEPYGLLTDQVQIEVVRVERDLRHEIHVHKQAHASITVLGHEEHLPDPTYASYYLLDRWKDATAGLEIDIPPRTRHGFTVDVGGIIYFLSVQSPPIERPDGRDDYHRLPDPKF